MSEAIVWTGKIDDIDVRIVQASKDDAYVEEKRTDSWEAVDDAYAAQVYMLAFLETRSALDDLYERDMGNRNLRTGLEALQNAGRLLGKSG